MDRFDTPPFDTPRPGFAAHAIGWSRTRLAHVTPLDPRIEALARMLAATCNVHGGVQLTQFAIHPDATVADYFGRNLLAGDFFHHFFSHPDVLEALPGVLPPERAELGFHHRTREDAFAVLVKTIRSGGAYLPYRGSPDDARKLAKDFGTAVGPRFWTGAWVSEEPWTGWFLDAGCGWDRSFFWFDRDTAVATVLLMTDTD